MTPLRLLELFFDDLLADLIVGCTKLYSHRKQTLVLKLLMKSSLSLKHATA